MLVGKALKGEFPHFNQVNTKRVLIINNHSYCTYTIYLQFLFLINHITLNIYKDYMVNNM